MAVDLDYARVVGEFGVSIPDGTDPDTTPDIVRCTAGTVTITPLIKSFVAYDAGKPVQLASVPYVATIANGVLTYNGQTSIDVVDLTSSKANPHIADGAATHSVSFAGMKAGTREVAFTDYDVRITAAGDGISGVGICDLNVLRPVTPAAAVPITRGPVGPDGPGIVDAQIVDGRLVLTLEVVGDVDAGPLPAGSDSTTAGWLGNAATLSGAALRAVVRTTPWNFTSLPTVNGQPIAPDPEVGDVIGLGQVLSSKADLGSDGKIPTSQIPTLPNGATFPVGSQAAMLALSTAVVGDFAVRSDLASQPYRLAALPASTIANWIAFGTAPSVSSVAGKTGTVTLALSDVANLVTSLAAKAPTASPTFTGTVTGVTKTHVGLGNVDNTSDAGKPISTAAAAALSGKADKSAGVEQLAGWADTVPPANTVPRYDGAQYSPVNLDEDYAQIGTDGRLEPASWPKYLLPTVVVDVGSSVPADFPTGGMVWERPAPTSLVPLLAGSGLGSGAGSTFTVTTTRALAIGDWVGISLMTSAETTSGVLPTILTLANPSTGAWTMSSAVQNNQAGTVQADIKYAQVTTAIPSGSTITFSLNQSRVHRSAVLFVMPSLTSAPLDRTAVGGGGSSTTLTLTTAATAATQQARELAICVLAHNDATAPTSRTITGTGGWTNLAAVESDNAASSRTQTVLYRVLTTSSAITGSGSVTASDASTGAWTGVVATFRAA